MWTVGWPRLYWKEILSSLAHGLGALVTSAAFLNHSSLS